MSDFNIKPTHKPIKTYYDELEKYAQHGAENEGTVRAAFQNLLQHYCHQIVIQSPTHALLYQHGELQLDLDLTEPRNPVRVLQGFFAYQEENISAWHTAVSEFKDTVPEQ